MADWRQIQARIRKAKGSSDPAAQLAELYERTRDAMVAFELAVWHEKAGNAAETVQWYTTAAQRFRRAQWRTKAEEALTRLGAPIPAPGPAPAPEQLAEPVRPAAAGSPQAASAEAAPGLPYMSSTEAERGRLHAGDELEPSPLEAPEPAEETAAAAAPEPSAGGVADKKRRRRGRRGGRKRRGRGGRPAAPAEAPA